MKTVIIISAVLSALTVPAYAHSGRTNAEGCHNDRRNGGYHCHGGGSRARSSAGANTQTRGMIGAGAGVGTRTRYYANCSEARAAGAAPIRRGQLGYGSHLDRDGDGVACER